MLLKHKVLFFPCLSSVWELALSTLHCFYQSGHWRPCHFCVCLGGHRGCLSNANVTAAVDIFMSSAAWHIGTATIARDGGPGSTAMGRRWQRHRRTWRLLPSPLWSRAALWPRPRVMGTISPGATRFSGVQDYGHYFCFSPDSTRSIYSNLAFFRWTNMWVSLESQCPGQRNLCWVQFSSVAQSCPVLCDPMDCSTPGFPVHHQLPELSQTHVLRVSDAIQPSHPLSSPSPSAFILSQHQGLEGVSS